MNYVEYNIWTGKIYKVSSVPSLSTKSNINVIQIDDPIIKDIINDKRSLESAFIGTNQKAYNKNGTIHLIKIEKEFTKITTKKNNNPDVTINLYTSNKLMEIIINYSSIKTWYNHRMKKKFKFNKNYLFEFKLNDVIFKIPSQKFLETFSTTIDLSNIKNLKNIILTTKKLFPNYYLNIQKYKYLKIDENNYSINIKKIDSKRQKEKYDMEIFLIKNGLKIKNNIPNIILNTIYKQLDFYITGKDPNELYDTISIPIEKLWENKEFIFKIKYKLDNKKIWCNNNIKVLLN